VELAELIGKTHDPERRARLKRAKADFGYFCTYYLPEHLSLAPAKFHHEIYELLMRESRVAVAAPREHAKSTVVNLGFVLYAICFKLKHFIVIVSDTDTQARYFLWSIKTELESNQRISQDFGDLVSDQKWTEGDFITGNNVRVLARGTGASMRGLRHGSHRPDLVIGDDLENDEAVGTLLQRQKTENWLKRVLLNCVGPDGQVFIIGTILHYDSLLSKLLKDEKWTRRKYKAIQDDGTPLWPERWPEERLRDKREEIGPLAFAQEFQNEPRDEDTALFREGSITYFDPVEIEGKPLQLVAMVDPSLGGSRTADYSAIVTVGRDPQSGYLYVMEAVIERLSPEALMDAIFRCFDKFHHIAIGFETVAFQKVLKLWLDERARKTGKYLPVTEVSQGGLSKEARVTRLSPLVENGTLRFSRKVQRLIEQLIQFPKGDHDDGPDALEGAVDLFRSVVAGETRYETVQRRRFTKGAPGNVSAI